jgi:hypothetical protein
MRKHFTKKRVVLLAVAALAIGLGTGAFAYFTSTGTGTGSATVGSASNWTVGQTGVTSGGPLYPDAAIGGANVQTNSYHVKNNNAGSQYLAQVDIKVANSDGSAWSSQTDSGKPACTKGDFSVDGSAVGTTHTDTALAGTFTAGQDKTTGSVTVEMIDNGANQDNCQGVTVPLYFSAS